MVKNNKRLIASLLFFGIGIIQISAQHVILTAERNHSSLGFAISIAEGFSRVTGKFTEYDLTIEYINEDILQSNFRIEIDVNSIQTGISSRDEHL